MIQKVVLSDPWINISSHGPHLGNVETWYMDVNGMPVYSPPRSGYLNRKPEVLAYFQTNPTGIFFLQREVDSDGS